MTPDWNAAMLAAEQAGLFHGRVLLGRSASGPYFVMSGRGVIAMNLNGPQCILDAIEEIKPARTSGSDWRL